MSRVADLPKGEKTMNRLTLNLLAGITVLVGGWALNPSSAVLAQEPPRQVCCWLDDERHCCGDFCAMSANVCVACVGDACTE